VPPASHIAPAAGLAALPHPVTDVEELLRERGVWVDHTSVFRWVQRYAPELDKRCRPQLNVTNDSYRVDETDIKIKKHWSYLYHAVDSTGAMLDFMLSPTTTAPSGRRQAPGGVRHDGYGRTGVSRITWIALPLSRAADSAIVHLYR
jgi:hypothetical protein